MIRIYRLSFHLAGYHWDTSDWMPSVQLPGIQEFPQYEVVESPPTLYNDPALLDTDYYAGGYDIESDFPPPPDDFPTHDDLPPPPPPPATYDTLDPAPSSPGGSWVRKRPPLPQLYTLNHYLPHHQYPPSDPEAPKSGSAAADNISLSLYASTVSCSDVEESEAPMSDCESGAEDGAQFRRLLVAPQQQQQHTEV